MKLWQNPGEVKENDVVKLENFKLNIFRGSLSLNCNKYTKIEILEDDDLRHAW